MSPFSLHLTVNWALQVQVEPSNCSQLAVNLSQLVGREDVGSSFCQPLNFAGFPFPPPRHPAVHLVQILPYLDSCRPLRLRSEFPSQTQRSDPIHLTTST